MLFTTFSGYVAQEPRIVEFGDSKFFSIRVCHNFKYRDADKQFWLSIVYPYKDLTIEVGAFVVAVGFFRPYSYMNGKGEFRMEGEISATSLQIISRGT